MSRLFEATTINGLTLGNRFVRSATWEGMATLEGDVTPKLTDTMIMLAKGGVGLIISGHAYVRKDGQASPWQLGIYSDTHMDGLCCLASAVHESGGKMVIQLAHAGNFSAENLTGQPPVVASAYEGLGKTPRKEIASKDIPELVDAYVRAAGRAKSAGFDGVQIHSAHGYLLSQFLSPIFNRRKDKYGGSIENRVRIHHEIIQAIRQIVGPKYPILIKMNGQDYAPDGLTLEDASQAAVLLEKAGVDAIELSGGLLTGGKLSPSRPGINSPEKEAYFREDARAFKQCIKIPLILVGGIRSFDVAEKLIHDGLADYISMSRPFIREPFLVNRWKDGDRSRASCLSDNLCFDPGREGSGIHCVTLARKKE
jgi:2,4-dienoyl-CoA reductase-like NADH-dependent reductase (Old Yellow Enzyme family)